MPAAQLVTSIIETGLNKLLALDPDSQQRLLKLEGQSLQVVLKELNLPLQFHFTHNEILITSEAGSETDCAISCDLATLNELKDPSQITRLIKSDRLELEGNIHIAQGFSELLKQLDIDWEEQLSQYTGDVLAYKLSQGAKTAAETLKGMAEEFRVLSSEFIIEEKRLTPHKIELIDFSDKVSEVRSDTERLNARVEQLSQQINKES